MVVARAPVRVSFAGGGTDLAAYYEQYGGLVVSAAITRYCYVVAQDPGDRSIRINSANYGTWQSCGPLSPADPLPPAPDSLCLPRAAIEWFEDRGLRQRGVELFLASEVPPGTGLGSSSAMAVALVRALAAYLGVELSPGEIAEAACTIEIELLGMPIGKQDQYASAFGGLNSIELAAGETRVTPIDLSPDVQDVLGAHLMLFSTGTSRHSGQILRQQQADTVSNQAVLDSLHRLKELAAEARRVLEAEDLDAFGSLLHAGWQHKKRLSPSMTSSAIDGSYRAARDAGALGGKITGAGGGGFLLLYCPLQHQQRVRTTMAARGLQELPFDLASQGVQVLLSAGRRGMTPAGPWLVVPRQPGRPGSERADRPVPESQERRHAG